MPFFSVIVPTKNRLALLQECVESVFAQEFEDFELIVVDDHSTDNTWSWLTHLDDSRVVPIKNKGIERSAARNAGLDMAKGEYICFIDDDDLVTPTFLGDFYKASKLHRGILRTNYKYFGEGKKVGKIGPVYCKDKYDNALRFVVEEFSGVWSLSIPRELATKENFDNRFPHWQDTHYIIRLLLKEHAMYQLNNANYRYRLHSSMGSLAVVQSNELKISKLAYFDKATINVNAMEDILINYPGLFKFVPKRIFRSEIAKKYMEYAINAFIPKYYAAAFKLFFKSFTFGFHPRLYKYYGYFFIMFFKNLIPK